MHFICATLKVQTTKEMFNSGDKFYNKKTLMFIYIAIGLIVLFVFILVFFMQSEESISQTIKPIRCSIFRINNYLQRRYRNISIIDRMISKPLTSQHILQIYIETSDIDKKTNSMFNIEQP